jgi:uncharacterized phiE125 gp8 family phage protein
MITDFYEITTPAAEDPVNFNTASEWCRDISTVDQTLVETLISAATKQCEKTTNRVFVSRTFTGKFVTTCVSPFEQNEYIELRRAPLISVTSVKVNGVALTVDVDYIIKESSSFSRILFLNSISPDADLGYPIEVEFVAGYGNQAAQPDWITTVIQQIVLFWYENRGDVSTDKKQVLPQVAIPILRQHKILNTYG